MLKSLVRWAICKYCGARLRRCLKRVVGRMPRKYPHGFETLKGCAHGPKEETLAWWELVIKKMDMKSCYKNCGITRYWFYTKWGAFLIEWGE